MITNKDNDDFENSTKCWIYDNDSVGNDDWDCHITGKYIDCAQF